MQSKRLIYACWLVQHPQDSVRPAIGYCTFLVQLQDSLKVIIITDVKINVKGLSVAVSIRSEDIFVEGSIYADGNYRIDILGSISTKGADACGLSRHSKAGQAPLRVHVLPNHRSHFAHTSQPVGSI